ncbi:CLUMA_CG018661, isoform A [Clunio marinus]|uniref:CLUMA_CG018661, isoform A n=1 Tax=Clunio marinus TaxID=568069 RepID=A0A1J1IZE4_9DIPT|nr:CLUMA_CG018661, isoform A [Clunio marinus]
MNAAERKALILEITKILQESFTASIDIAMIKLSRELTDLFQPQLKLMDTKVKRMNSRVESGEKRIDDIIETNKRICNLRLDGLPFVKGENVKNVINSLSSAIGYRDSPEFLAYRMKKETNSTIIIRFPTYYYKEEFLNRYLANPKAVTVKTLLKNGDSTARCFLSNDLCKTFYDIHKAAIKFKKDGSISKIRVSHGFVMIKKDDASPFRAFDSLAALQKEFGSNTKQTMEA